MENGRTLLINSRYYKPEAVEGLERIAEEQSLSVTVSTDDKTGEPLILLKGEHYWTPLWTFVELDERVDGRIDWDEWNRNH